MVLVVVVVMVMVMVMVVVVVAVVVRNGFSCHDGLQVHFEVHSISSSRWISDYA